MSKRALLLINRHSRKGEKSLPLAVEYFYAHDMELIIKPVKHPDELGMVVREYQNQIDFVIVGGGDGTLNAVVDSLVETNLPLGILPLGTANDLARTLNLPLTMKEACDVIGKGKTKSIDLGWVNGKYFFNVASMGLSVDITEKLSRGVKRRWGILAYGITALQVIGSTRPFRATIKVDGQCFPIKTIQIAIGNGRYYGGGMAIANDAAIDDQRLDLYSIELEHWWQIFPLIWHLPKGEHHQLNWVRSIEGKLIEVYTHDSYNINTDGEITTITPAKFKVIPHALKVFVL
ncbi:lipid kinase [Geminocystis sp. NIES-3709]|uniref:lipid kinase n=1 Tax=Geminocystis sp. NIES-3709 TaxID=1617448 RepID=UPI0005FCC215|nr:lipid kinase [Geminocystis sp. NIES-3709]BAQ64785.1 transcription regulator [contains diacylglycerol kinase catalytic domain] [Geminocystis sp. NIES-3709]